MGRILINMMRYLFFVLTVVLFTGGFMFAEESTPYNSDLDYAQVLHVAAEKETSGGWSFSVKVRHADTGWDHYANLWEVVDTETGEVLGSRELLHPHVNEQPFIRSLNGVAIPEAVEQVAVRARCNQHGFEGKQVVVDLSQESGDDFTVSR
mgnify:CR=1 FL=1